MCVCVFVCVCDLQLILVDKIDVSWWAMETSDGKRGMVPVNYTYDRSDQKAS